MAQKKGGLGRGLESLFEETARDVGREVSTLPLRDIEPDKEQPRKDFSEEPLSELAASITEHGVLQPITVRPCNSGGYKIIAGERRWRAARLAGLSEIPVIIKDVTESEAMEMALIENLQREDLDPVEEAFGYKQLMERCGLTQEQAAKRLGMAQLLRQALGEWEERFAQSGLTLVPAYPEEEISIMADGRHLWRVLDNLFNNVCKYALAGTRVYIDAGIEGNEAVISVKNISRDPLNVSADELMERFVRGDSSRHTEGSGLGLNIAQSLVNLMHGKFSLSVDGDLFKAEIRLPLN